MQVIRSSLKAAPAEDWQEIQEGASTVGAFDLSRVSIEAFQQVQVAKAFRPLKPVNDANTFIGRCMFAEHWGICACLGAGLDNGRASAATSGQAKYSRSVRLACAEGLGDVSAFEGVIEASVAS